MNTPACFGTNAYATMNVCGVCESEAACRRSASSSREGTKAAEPVVAEKFIPGGRKADNGKDPWHLLPTDAVRAIVKVLAFGASKYGDRNWEKGMAWSRCHAALLRHMMSWWEGEGLDEETGFSHLWHAGCCILFLIAYEIRGIGIDDRATPPKP